VSVDTVLSLTVAGLLPAHPFAGRVLYARANVTKMAASLRKAEGVKSESPPENGP
jgi:hypothetical protein